MKVIGLDLATNCGWGVLSPTGNRIASGTWDCSVRRGESRGMRFVRFAANLRELVRAYPGAIVYFEKVEHHTGTEAAHVHGGLLAQMQVVLDELGVQYAGIPVATIKKQATGKGNASKAAMIAAANARWAPYVVVDDNDADGLWAAECGRVGVVA